MAGNLCSGKMFVQSHFSLSMSILRCPNPSQILLVLASRLSTLIYLTLPQPCWLTWLRSVNNGEENVSYFECNFPCLFLNSLL